MYKIGLYVIVLSMNKRSKFQGDIFENYRVMFFSKSKMAAIYDNPDFLCTPDIPTFQNIPSLIQ